MGLNCIQDFCIVFFYLMVVMPMKALTTDMQEKQFGAAICVFQQKRNSSYPEEKQRFL